MNKSKAITSSVKLFFAGYFLIIAVFLTALKSLLNLAIEDFLSLKPYTLAVMIDSYAMTTSSLLVSGLFLLFCLRHERLLLRNNPAIFESPSRLLYVNIGRFGLLGWLFWILSYDGYRVLSGTNPSWTMLLETALSLVIILTGFAVVFFAKNSRSFIISKTAAVLSDLSILSLCVASVAFTFHYASPFLVQAAKKDQKAINFLGNAEMGLRVFYADKKALPDSFKTLAQHALSKGSCYGGLCEMPPETFRYEKQDDQTCKVCVHVKTSVRQRLRHKVFSFMPYGLRGHKTENIPAGEYCRTASFS
ncbi:MAG: hypothetical protein ACPGUZ_01235 [Holosporaceae bacterium]